MCIRTDLVKFFGLLHERFGLLSELLRVNVDLIYWECCPGPHLRQQYTLYIYMEQV